MTQHSCFPTHGRAPLARPRHAVYRCRSLLRILKSGGLLAIVGLALAGCQPDLGDGCSSSVDCSVDGERICDTAQPDGYCTIPGCTADTCPSGGVCVEFRYETQRLSSSWCMAKCNKDSGCREADGYQCVEAADILDDEGNPLARTLGPDEHRHFCAAVTSLSDS